MYSILSCTLSETLGSIFNMFPLAPLSSSPHQIFHILAHFSSHLSNSTIPCISWEKVLLPYISLKLPHCLSLPLHWLNTSTKFLFSHLFLHSTTHCTPAHTLTLPWKCSGWDHQQLPYWWNQRSLCRNLVYLTLVLWSLLSILLISATPLLFSSLYFFDYFFSILYL